MRRSALLALVSVLVAPAALAAPAPLDRLPSEVAGVVGSGDKLSLQIRPDAGGRTIAVGEDYKDGWKLKALSPSSATLTKDGQDQVIGLNLTGQVASAAPAAAATQVRVAGIPDLATIDAYVARAFARNPNYMSPEAAADPERRRGAAYQVMMQDEIDRRRAEVEAGTRTGSFGMNQADMRALLGDAAYEDYMAISAKVVAASRAREAADLAARPITGPNTYYVPAGANRTQIMAAAGIDQRGIWQNSLPDANGGVTVTRVGQSSADMPAVMAAQRAAAGLPPITPAPSPAP